MASGKSPASRRKPTRFVVVDNLEESVTADVIKKLLILKNIRTKAITMDMAASPGHYTARIELMDDSDTSKVVSALNGTKIFGGTVSAMRCDRGPSSGQRKQATRNRDCDSLTLSSGFSSTNNYFEELDVERFKRSVALCTKPLSSSIKVTGFAIGDITDLERKLRQHFSSVGAVVSCKVMEKSTSSKPYAYINFINSTCAKKAVKNLHMTELDGNVIKVKFQGAEPVNGAAIKVTQLPLNVTESDLRTHCHTFGNILSVKVINSNPPHAFVTFSNSDEASNAALSLNHLQFMGTTIKVTVVSQQGKPIEIYIVLIHYFPIYLF